MCTMNLLLDSFLHFSSCDYSTHRYRNAGYLDIDVGQPEFTPPGFVSLHVLEEQTKGVILKLLFNNIPLLDLL